MGLINERRYNADVIEAALAHQDTNAIRRTYNQPLDLLGGTGGVDAGVG